MSGVHYPTFADNIAGGAIWATGLVLLGYAGNSSYRRVESVAKSASVLLLGLVVVVGVTVYVARRIARHPERIRAFGDGQANRRWVAFVRARYRRQLDFLVRRLRPSQILGLSLTVSLGLIAVAGWALGALTQDVLSRESLNMIDRPVLRFFVRHREPGLTGCSKVVTALGSSAVLIPLIVVIGLVWWWRRRTWRPSVLLVGAYGGAEGLFNVDKALVGRPRPPMALALAHFSGSAFPSGHATLSMAVWGMVAALAADATTRWSRKVAVWAAALLVAAFVGVTRLYLGAHWFTDVAGGWALGTLWLFALLTTVRTVAVVRRGPSQTVPAGGRPGTTAVAAPSKDQPCVAGDDRIDGGAATVSELNTERQTLTEPRRRPGRG